MASLLFFVVRYAPIDRHIEQSIRHQVQQEQRGDAANRKEEIVERYVTQAKEENGEKRLPLRQPHAHQLVVDMALVCLER